jgi:hypothetical protein
MPVFLQMFCVHSEGQQEPWVPSYVAYLSIPKISIH